MAAETRGKVPDGAAGCVHRGRGHGGRGDLGAAGSNRGGGVAAFVIAAIVAGCRGIRSRSSTRGTGPPGLAPVREKGSAGSSFIGGPRGCRACALGRPLRHGGPPRFPPPGLDQCAPDPLLGRCRSRHAPAPALAAAQDPAPLQMQNLRPGRPSRPAPGDIPEERHGGAC